MCHTCKKDGDLSIIRVFYLTCKSALRHLFVIGLFALTASCSSSDDDSGEEEEQEPISMTPEPINETRANTISLVSVETLTALTVSDSAHATHIPADEVPANGVVVASVTFLKKPSTLQLQIVTANEERGAIIQWTTDSLADDYFYIGTFNSPGNDFSYLMSGTLESGEAFSTSVPRSFPPDLSSADGVASQ